MCVCVFFHDCSQTLTFNHQIIFASVCVCNDIFVCVCVCLCSKASFTIELYIGANSVPQFGSVSTGDHLTLKLFPLLQHKPSLL